MVLTQQTQEVKAWTVIFPSLNERAELLGQRPYIGRTCKRHPWHRLGGAGMGPDDRDSTGTVTEKWHGREDWELNIPEEMSRRQAEMSGRQAEISAPAQGDWWFTLWPASTSHQSSHRKIMSPSNEFMQMVVHLSEGKMKTLEVLSRQEQAKSPYLYVSSFCSCLLSDLSLHQQHYTGSPVQKGTWLYPIKSHAKSILLKKCKWKPHRLCRQMLLKHNVWIENKHKTVPTVLQNR